VKERVTRFWSSGDIVYVLQLCDYFLWDKVVHDEDECCGNCCECKCHHGDRESESEGSETDSQMEEQAESRQDESLWFICSPEELPESDRVGREEP
jgi:hypothetical protein